MSKRQASLSDKFELDDRRQLLSGTQAIVRLALMQKARDRAAGLDTAGFVTGYRGSPIATIESAFAAAGDIPPRNDILFQPAINEDLAATAIWGSQQAELRGEGKFDGVFAIWYGKGPGVDRSGDAFRHANHAGTSKHGGVIALMGDDHTCESSTSAHQSEFAFVDAMIPILNPAGVQEILDYGLYGFALSRYAGVWTGIKCVKDNVESTATVDGSLDRITIHAPSATECPLPDGGLNIRLGDTPVAKEARLHDWKRSAIQAFVRSNRLDRVIFDGGTHPAIGIVTTGKSYLDTRAALAALGIDETRAARLGLALYKVAMTWPLEPAGLAEFASGLDLIVVVEEKRSLIETQLKEQLYELQHRPRVVGKRDEHGAWLFPPQGTLDPLDIALAIGTRILERKGDAGLSAAVTQLHALRSDRPTEPEAFTRTAYFCAGCPHNSSTVVPAGSRAYAGIGCHYMAQWMDRATEGFTQMGGEGANWIGEAPFSKRGHVFQNIGDGTYVHSGSLAIRAAVAAKTTMTFKLLYNDAVAMTGGQHLDGGLTAQQMAAQMLAEGVGRLDIVTDEPGKFRRGDLPGGVRVHHRRDLDTVQRELAGVQGVTVLIYDQTCAAEKRRRWKRGTLISPNRRVFINPLVCEGCGDCGRKSNCVAVLPLETPFGRKREIDQSQCNKDFSCVEGFCPSFVTLDGATPRRNAHTNAVDTAGHLTAASTRATEPEPARPALDRPFAVLVTGVGGTGVVTVSAVLAQAAHIAGLGFGSIDVTGIAQKGGAVACHLRIAERTQDITAIRVGVADADLILGGDLVVTASNKILETIRRDHTTVVHATSELVTGGFTRDPGLMVPGARLASAIAERVGRGALVAVDAHAAAVDAFGDSLYANMILLGVAAQKNAMPIPALAIELAIQLNGAAAETNIAAFRLGRELGARKPANNIAPRSADRAPAGTPVAGELETIVAIRSAFLEEYQDAALAQRYRRRIEALGSLEATRSPGHSGLTEAAARGYFKLLAYKDEYEVARLQTDATFERLMAAKFEGVQRIFYHLAPPIFARRDPRTGEPRKLRFGPWLRPLLKILAKGKALRGTPWDPFGYTAERKLERRMISEFEALLDEIGKRLSPETHAAAVALAALPEDIRGFGHIKRENCKAAKRREAQLLVTLRQPPRPSERRPAAE